MDIFNSSLYVYQRVNGGFSHGLWLGKIINGGFPAMNDYWRLFFKPWPWLHSCFTYEKCWCSIAMLLYRRVCLVMFPGWCFLLVVHHQEICWDSNTSNGMTEMAAGTGSGTSKSQRNYAKAIYLNRWLRSIWQRFDKENYQSILSFIIQWTCYM